MIRIHGTWHYRVNGVLYDTWTGNIHTAIEMYKETNR